MQSDVAEESRRSPACDKLWQPSPPSRQLAGRGLFGRNRDARKHLLPAKLPANCSHFGGKLVRPPNVSQSRLTGYRARNELTPVAERTCASRFVRGARAGNDRTPVTA